jgi:hypothetical protein
MAEKRKIEEKYQRLEDADRSFDIRFWQEKGDIAIFKAMEDMINDYLKLRGKDAHESRIQRTVEAFRRT